jgi:hypothetical protein
LRQGAGATVSAGSIGSTGASDNRSFDAGSPRPTADVSAQSYSSANKSQLGETRSDYEPRRSETIVTERRSPSRPSTTAVIGSAVAAAVVGGAVPFMLAARKSRQSDDVSVQQSRTNADAEFANNRSPSSRIR